MILKLCRFFSQYKLEDFLGMDVSVFNKFVSAMEQLEAQEQLLKMDYISYPHMSEKERRKKHKQWSKAANPRSFEQKIIKTSDLELI